MPNRIFMQTHSHTLYVPFHIFIIFFFFLKCDFFLLLVCIFAQNMRFHIAKSYRTCIWTTPNCTWPEILKLHIQFESAATREPCLCTKIQIYILFVHFNQNAAHWIRFSFSIFAFHFDFLLTFSPFVCRRAGFVCNAENNRSKTYIHYSQSKHWCILRHCWLASKCGKAFVTTLCFRFCRDRWWFFLDFRLVFFPSFFNFAKFHHFFRSFISVRFACASAHISSSHWFVLVFLRCIRLFTKKNMISIQTCLLKLCTGALKLHRKHFKMISETVKNMTFFMSITSVSFTHSDVIASVGMNLWLVKPENTRRKKRELKFTHCTGLQRLAF